MKEEEEKRFSSRFDKLEEHKKSYLKYLREKNHEYIPTKINADKSMINNLKKEYSESRKNNKGFTF